MATKKWELAMGERSMPPENSDELLKSKVSERQRREIERQEERDEAKHEAEMAKYKKEAATASAAADKSGEKKDESGGFKIHGGINLGEIDYQKMQQEQTAELNRLRQEAENAAAHQQQVSEELRDKLHAAEMEVLKTTFGAQVQTLTKMIEQGVSKGSFTEQLNAARETAKELGFAQVTPNGGDAMVQIELKKLDFEHQKAMREMARADKAEERRWQMELKRLDDEREERKERLKQEKEKMDLIKGIPQAIGEAAGAALLAGNTGGAPVSSQPQTAKQFQIEVPKGWGGEADCPECGEVIGIGQTARQAICAKCNTKLIIKRTDSAGEEEGPPPPNATEEDMRNRGRDG